ncbi:formyltransferase family protein [Phaeodactylibacter xiamenensis]|uniref:formyltransferase family protein n=1 Tax=Phaeodactylibacter xiamenensis TaxID=1524460 RepID=UPI0024A88059|nr:formyltransferase family protein [Phaeodactylibacter xiamenensis]
MAVDLSVLLLCGDTNRAKAYLHALQHVPNLRVSAIYYGVQEVKKASSTDDITIDRATREYLESVVISLPDFNLSTEDYLIRYGIDFYSTRERDVNSKEILDLIGQSSAEYIIFAGYGGQILSRDHFLHSKKYIHCHPGWLPEERGSTTLYYSILRNKALSVTSFLMTAEIDKGDILLRNTYPRPKQKVDIDVFVDNSLRADTLKKTLLNILNGQVDFVERGNEKDEEFYVIHPLLKHVALMSLDVADVGDINEN